MPPDVFLLLASSGLSLVASLMFFVSDDRPVSDEPKGPLMSFCLPPLRPPPLPRSEACSVNVSTPQVAALLTLKPKGEDWELALECAPRGDAALVQVDGAEVGGVVSDLRWHQRAGVLKSSRKAWKVKPGRA